MPERRNQSYDDSLRELSDDVYNDAGKEERKVEKDFLKFIIISSNFHHQDIRYEEYDIWQMIYIRHIYKVYGIWYMANDIYAIY